MVVAVGQELGSIYHHLEMMDEILETCLGNHVVDHSWLVTLGDLVLVVHVDLEGWREGFDLVVVDVA